MKKFTLLMAILISVFNSKAQNVNILDPNFKSFLLNNSSINTNSDTLITLAEAQAYTGSINCSSMGISDLTGIEAFVNITELLCNSNNLTSLDLTNNISLTYLQCYSNQLTVLNINNLPLTNLNCYDNRLTSLDVSTNNALLQLTCGLNQLTSLDISNNLNLKNLSCQENQLTSINTSNNSQLIGLGCSNNQITSLGLNNNINLVEIYCQNNSINFLDLSNNDSLTRVNCSRNQLNSLNIANGTNLRLLAVYTNMNPSLGCIQVDDSLYSENNWTGGNFVFDSISVFSENCNIFVNQVVTLSSAFNFIIYPNPVYHTATIQFAASGVYSIQVFDMSGKLVHNVQVNGQDAQINTSAWTSGMYTVKITDEAGKSEIKKIVKE